MTEAEELAKFFHEQYETLAPEFGYRTREESAVAWEEVPKGNKGLMVAVCARVIARQDQGPFKVELNAIARELDYAHKKWGTEFDDKNTLNDWVTCISMYATDAAKMGNTAKQIYGFFIKAAGLAVNAAGRVRTDRIADRHYEGLPADEGHGKGTGWEG